MIPAYDTSYIFSLLLAAVLYNKSYGSFDRFLEKTKKNASRSHAEGKDCLHETTESGIDARCVFYMPAYGKISYKLPVHKPAEAP